MSHSSIRALLKGKYNRIGGKSATLTALQIALGMQARQTDRSESLKGFVRRGQPYAIVSVSIRNKGRDSYRHSVYGDVITIDRKIMASGASSRGWRASNSGSSA